MACKDYHDLGQGISYRKVYDYEGGATCMGDDGTVVTDAFAYHVSIACNHCNQPACVHVCPTGAMHKDTDTGLVSVNGKVCIGCGYCTMACPYHSPAISDVTNTSAKCDGCRSRVAEGKLPICVEACPLRALEFGDIDVLLAAHPDAVRSLAPLPPSSDTSPNLLIRTCPAACPTGSTEGHTTNVDENNYLRF